jgi:predicted metalloprotease
MIRVSRVVAAVSAMCAGLLIAGCSTVTQGHAVSTLYDPFRAGGLPAEDGPSGIRDNAPQPTGDVQDTDGGDIDRLTLLAVNDVADFWEKNYSASLDGTFTPIERLVSYDSNDPSSPAVCGTETYQEPNAFYCPSRKIMAWDRAVMVPTGREFFGDVSIAALMAHEYGHAVQHMAGIVDDSTTVIVSEQQADCFAGTYIRWVAEGQSPRTPKCSRRATAPRWTGSAPSRWDSSPVPRSAPRSTSQRSSNGAAICRWRCHSTRPATCRAAR